jgi:hypothetical protein
MSVKDKFFRYLAADVVGSYWLIYVADASSMVCGSKWFIWQLKKFKVALRHSNISGDLY